jgi:hypothetical protein
MIVMDSGVNAGVLTSSAPAAVISVQFYRFLHADDGSRQRIARRFGQLACQLACHPDSTVSSPMDYTRECRRRRL